MSGFRVPCPACGGKHWEELSHSVKEQGYFRVTLIIDDACPICDENGLVPEEPQVKGILNVTGVQHE